MPGSMPRDLDDRPRSHARRLQPERRELELELEPPTHGLQTERARADARVSHARAVVLDDADERTVLGAERSADDHLARPVAPAEGAVLHRVLDERLQEQAREHRALALRRALPS